MTTFVHTKKDYDSYRDWWNLVRLSGFDECLIDAVDLGRDEFYIFGYANKEMAAWLKSLEPLMRLGGKKRRATLVHWELERPDQDDALLEDRGSGFRCGGFDAVWASDRSLAASIPGAVHAVLGSHKGLRMSNPRISSEYDWTHQSYEVGRRRTVYDKIRALGLKEAPPAWGHERDFYLNASRVMVNVLQTPTRVMAPLRLALAAAYRMPVVTETLDDPWPLDHSDFAAMVGVDDIPEAVRRAVNGSWTGETAAGASLYHKLCVEWTFTRGVEDAVRRTI